MSQRILVVDDDEMIRTMVAHLLRRAGYEVVLGSDGPTALTLFETDSPQLVILDISMPEMSGIEVARQMRAIQQRRGFAHVPIVLLTAYARSFAAWRGGDADADSYLTKPISPEKLVQHVQQFLRPNPEEAPRTESTPE